MPRAKQRTPELRDRILHAAVAMLAAEGVSGFTTRKIAQQAETSIPAVYELFGDKAGLVREVFFEGFRHLRARFDELTDTDDPRADLIRIFGVLRSFVRENPILAEVMFSRPFTDFDPRPTELRANRSVREYIVGHVRRCVDVGLIAGDETDIAHVLLALAQGLAAQETAGWLGTSNASRDRRWALAFQAVLDGLTTP
ncbi:TetR/AcrR family transcriptional regulator [Streptomyces sp. NPDC051636]|uniref:TetR/AcrR family transcriptional regulator n=1 Tax=Streptomyces sp. NPDC051636 TaxID=3365663 RepID=UPI0037AD2D78